MKPATADKIKSILRDFYQYSPKNDPWGTAMQAFFDVAGEMFNRSMRIPSAWQFHPGAGVPTIEEDDKREEIEGLTNGELSRFGAVLDRLTDILRRKGMDY